MQAWRTTIAPMPEQMNRLLLKSNVQSDFCSGKFHQNCLALLQLTAMLRWVNHS
ncbi:MAG: hypothetical protein RBJ76_22965 [Stenomitos frigidus ULC029]